jgi:hypothetical protein
MTMLSFSDMPTFAVGLILKHFSCTLLLNQFGPFSNSWHVAVNSDVKHTMHPESPLLTWNPSSLRGAILVHPGPRLLVN